MHQRLATMKPDIALWEHKRAGNSLEQAQFLNFAESTRHLLALVTAGKFALDKVTY